VRLRRAAGELGEQARKRVGRLRGRRIGVDQRLVGELREVRAQLGGDANLEVDGVEAVDADQQHMVDVLGCIGVASRRRRHRQQQRGTECSRERQPRHRSEK
jgi:hypothetical protein